MKQTLSYLWKLSLCSLGFFIGMALNSIALDALSFQSLKMLTGTETNTLMIWLFLGSMLLALILSFFSRGLKINWLGRGFILLELFWLFGIGGISVGLSLSITMGILASFILSLFVMLNLLLPGLLLSGLVTVLFKPAQPIESLSQNHILSSQAVNPVRAS
jgi:hypothetical protein